MIYFTAVVLALAVARLTRLVVQDTFPPVLWLRDRLAGEYRQPTRAERWHPNYPVGELRENTSRAVPGLRGLWSLDKDGQIQVWIPPWQHAPHWLAELITCPWCASGWITGGLTAITDITVGLPVPWLTGLAAWGVGAWLAAKA